MNKVFYSFIIFLFFFVFCCYAQNENNNRFKIEILNGTNITGFANEVAVFIRKNYPQYDVIKIGSTGKEKYMSSVVLARQKDVLNYAEMLAKYLNINTYYYLKNQISYVDITLIIGKDFEIPKINENGGKGFENKK